MEKVFERASCPWEIGPLLPGGGANLRPPPPRGVNFLLGGPDPLSKRFLGDFQRFLRGELSARGSDPPPRGLHFLLGGSDPSPLASRTFLDWRPPWKQGADPPSWRPKDGYLP